MNKYTGEAIINIAGKDCKVVYNYQAISKFQSKYGKNADINDFNLDDLVTTLLIGFEEHSSDVTKDDILKSSPPMVKLSDVIVEAFLYAQYGVEDAIEIMNRADKAVKDVKKKTLKTK